MIERQHYNIAVRDCLTFSIGGGDILLKEDPDRAIDICN